MYLDIKEELNKKIAKIEKILKFGTGTGILITMDSNSRSQAWHDKQTNMRGRTLEDYLASRDLNVVNEESDHTTYQSRRGRSNIDLTITNNRILKYVKDCEVSTEDSCSDHSIIKFSIGQEKKNGTQYNYTGKRYITTEESYNRFDHKLQEAMAKEFRIEGNGDSESLDNNITRHIKETEDIDIVVEKIQTAITTSCKTSFTTLSPRVPHPTRLGEYLVIRGLAHNFAIDPLSGRDLVYGRLVAMSKV